MVSENGVNYIVACYLGERRTPGPPGEVFIKRHLDYLQDKNVPVSRVSIVVSTDSAEDANRALNAVKKYDGYYTNLKFFIRRNVSYSYGAWNDTVNDSIRNLENFDYFFLVEDDYLPARDDFLKILIDRLNDKTAYVCQKVYDAQPGGFQRHASASSGMLHGVLAKEVYGKFDSVFDIKPAINYPQAETNQVNFLNYIRDSGYNFSDISDISGIHFLENLQGSGARIKTVDELNGPPLLLPIMS